MDFNLFPAPPAHGFTEHFVRACGEAVKQDVFKFLGNMVMSEQGHESLTVEHYEAEKNLYRSMVIHLKHYRTFLVRHHEKFVDEQSNLAHSLCGERPSLKEPGRFVEINNGFFRHHQESLVQVVSMEDFNHLTKEIYSRNKVGFSTNLVTFKEQIDAYVASIVEEHAPTYTNRFNIASDNCCEAAAKLMILIEDELERLPERLQEVERTKRRVYHLRRRLLGHGNAVEEDVLNVIYHTVLGLGIETECRRAKSHESKCRQAMFDYMGAANMLYSAEVVLKSMWLMGHEDIRSIKRFELTKYEKKDLSTVMTGLDKIANEWEKVLQVERGVRSKILDVLMM